MAGMAWNARRLLAIIPFILCLRLETVHTKPSTVQDGNGAIALKCLLRSEPSNQCLKVTGYMLPNRLLQMYTNMSRDVKDSIRSRKLQSLTSEKLAKLPVQLFLLIPAQHLHLISGSSLAALLKSHPKQVALTVKILGLLDQVKAKDLFHELEHVELTARIQYKMAEMLVHWFPNITVDWGHEKFRMIEKVGNPLLAYFPPQFLASLSDHEAIRVLYNLRNWLWSHLPEDVWNGKSLSSKRVWTDMMFRSSYPFNISRWSENEGRRFRYLLEGATPDELQLFKANTLRNSRLFKAKLTSLQVRALFEVLYSHAELTSANLTDSELLPVALQLSPANLQRFNITSTDFAILSSQAEGKYSYATALQIAESLIAQAVFSKKLNSVKPESWGDGIEHVGKFVFVLPPSALESYTHKSLSLMAQSSIDSDKLSSRQARLLTGGIVLNLAKPEMMMGQKGLLRALPSSQLVNTPSLPQNLLSHLLSSLPSGLSMQAAAVLVKVGKLNGKSWALKAILSNKDSNQFFQLLSAISVSSLVKDLENVKGFDTVIRKLPQNTLSVLLTAKRTKLSEEEMLWTSETLLSMNSLLGLSCNDIYAMETVDFIYIMERYNKERRLVNKPFPKDLQYCSQMALMNYLEMKASLQDDKTADELLDFLEPADIEAVGGYILGNLPMENIARCPEKQRVLESVGQLPLAELLVATKETNPWSYAQLLLNHYVAENALSAISSKELFGMGNLVHFLKSNDVMKINPASFKLYVESVTCKSKQICADSATRLAWSHIILKAFGEPYKWTAGILATLGDFLLVVPEEDLNSVPEESWRNAADTLVQRTHYHLKVEWPGKAEQISYFEACSDMLGTSEAPLYENAVRQLARWYLIAVQDQLNTVVNASQLLRTTHRAMRQKTDKKKIHEIPVELVHTGNVVRVLDANLKPPEHKGENDEKDVFDDYLNLTTESQATTSMSSDLETTEITTLPGAVSESFLTDPASSTINHVITSSAISSHVNNPSTVSLSSETQTDGKDSFTFSGVEVTTLVMTEQVFPSSESVTETTTQPSLNTLTSMLNNIEHFSEFTTLKSIIETTTSKKSTDDDKVEDYNPNNYSVPFTAVPESDVSLSTTAFTTLSSSTAKSATNMTTVPSFKTTTNSDKTSNSSEPNLEDNLSNSIEDDELDPSSKTFDLESKSRVKKIAKRQIDPDEESDINVHKILGNPFDQSGDILRGVLKKKAGDSDSHVAKTTTKPEMKKSTEKPRLRKLPKLWKQISCHAIKAAGSAASLAIDETDIDLMDAEELEDCVDALGSLELSEVVRNRIWGLIDKDKFLPNLSDLGCIVRALDVDDVSSIDLSLSNPGTLDNLAVLSAMVTDSHVLHELGLQFVKSNPDLRTLSIELTMALGRILCDVLEIVPQKLHELMGETVFLKASPVLGRMRDCPTHCLHKLAHMATRSSEYGPLHTWRAEDIATLGIIPAGLKPEHWRKLISTGYGKNPLVGLQPSAVKYIPPQVFKELNEDQLKSLPALSSALVSEEQLSHLSESQQIALMRVQRDVPALKLSESTDLTESRDLDSAGASARVSACVLIVSISTVVYRFSVI